MEFIKRDVPNEIQKKALQPGTKPKGNPLFLLKSYNKLDNKFTHCIGVNNEGNIERGPCNMVDENQLWRIKDKDDEDDTKLDLRSKNINNKKINIKSNKSFLPNNKYCFNQEYDQEGNLIEKMEICSYDDEDYNFKYKSLKLTDLTY